MTDKTQFHIQRLDSLRQDRGNWNAQWEEAAAIIVPAHRDTFLGRGNNEHRAFQGQKKTEQQ